MSVATEASQVASTAVQLADELGTGNKVHGSYAQATATSLPEGALFGGLTDDERAALLPRWRRLRHRKGARIFMHGDLGRDLYVIESGSVKICMTTADGKELT